jgi:trigger factor
LEKTVRSPRQWLREIDVEIEPDRLKSKLESFLTEYQDKAALPGFRPGKVPRRLLEKRIGGQLETAAVEELVEDAVKQALEGVDWKVAGAPRFTNLEVTPEKAIRFMVSVEVIPDFELKAYSGLSLRREEPPGFDAEFERRVQSLRERCAEYKPLARPAQAGDYVVVDYRTSVDGADQGQPKANVMMELGDKLNAEEVNAALTGSRPGEERTADVPVPPDHQDKALAGRTMVYRFTVRDVKERILPELTEEFAQDLGYESLDKLRIELNEGILADRAKLAENGLKNQVFDFLTSAHDFEPPDAWVQAALERLRRQYELPDDEPTREKLRPSAVKWAKFDCLVSLIVEKEGLRISDDEMEQEVRDLAASTKRPVEEVRPLLDSPAYRNQLLREKVLRLVMDKAEVS